MEYTVQLKEDLNLIHATASGEWESQTDNAMVRAIMETVDASGSRKVLLDIRELHFDLPIIHYFERVKEMRAQRQQFGITSTRTAIVYSSTDKKLEQDLTFFETASRNRGLPYCVFQDLEEAMAWLLSEG